MPLTHVRENACFFIFVLPEPVVAAAVHQDAPGVSLAVQEASAPHRAQDRCTHQVMSEDSM